MDINTYLLAELVAIHKNMSVEAVLAEARSSVKGWVDNKPKEAPNEAVERVYAAYPSKCPISGRSTGKCAKNKKQIATMLKTRSLQDMVDTINAYLADCKSSNTYIKNFGTLLNQFPENKPEQPAPTIRQESGHQEIWDDPIYKQWRERHQDS